jgi:hypothetical protein
MGLVILPVAIFFVVIWVALSVSLATGAVLILKRLHVGRVAQVLVFLVVLGVSWFAPNIKGLSAQRRINAIAKDCGWAVFKTVDAVDGVYLDAREGGSASFFYKEIYGNIEDGSRGEKRTFRYGFRSSHSMVTSDIQKDVTLIMDFDKNEILARHVEYSFSATNWPRTVTDYAIALITVRPKPCGFSDALDSGHMYRKILSPKNVRSAS